MKIFDMTSPVLNSTTQNYQRSVQVLSTKFEVQYWPREWPEKKFSQRVQILHYKHDQYEIFSVLI